MFKISLIWKTKILKMLIEEQCDWLRIAAAIIAAWLLN